MNLHIIVDFMHIYYKYFFQNREGKLTKLSAPIEWKGTVIEKDTTMIYYPLRDVEGIRKNLEGLGHKVTMSICFDSRSQRKDGDTDGATEYKSGRIHALTETDHENIDFIQRTLEKAGHNTYRIDGYEADDIANYLSKRYADNFDYVIIYTNDKDLLVNINSKVGVMRFKQYKGYTQVDMNNYEQYLEQEFGVFIPYNALGLYLSTVGDSADNIKGIYKFGKVAFKKLITKVAASNNIDWKKCGDYMELAKVVDMCSAELSDEQYKQMVESFALVANLKLNDELVKEPTKISTQQLREETYSEYKMISLIP